MPGVRMMAPIPDKLAPAPSAIAAAPRVIPAHIMSAADHAALQQAFAAAGRDWNRARLLAAQAGNPVGRLIIEWRYVLDEMSGANFETINAFLNEHPNWPRRDALAIRAEKTMPDLDPKDVIAWYANRPPLSGIGMIRLGDALMQSGQNAEGAALIRKAWIEYTYSPFDENEIVAAHGNVLGAAEQKARLDHLLARDDIGGAKRQMLRVDAETQRLANARLKIKASPATVKTVLASLPQSAQANPEFLLDVARALRKRGEDEQAWVVMEKAPSNKSALAIAERWSAERQIMARDALKAGKLDLAYRFASTPQLDPSAGATFMDGEFLAGWIALRFLHKPGLAFEHFDRLAKGVTYPISLARAHYWLGRTAEAMNLPADAAAEYRKAADHPATFYGQLALAKISENPILHVSAVVDEPSQSERATFESDERIQAVRLLSEFGDRTTIRLFAASVANDPPDPRRLQMLAQLVVSTGDPAMSVRVAKNASYSDIYLLSYLHPVMTLPQVADAPESALVLGLARQESEFDPGVVSSAGARGLMQLMPASAKRAAAMRGLPYRVNDLTANPAYNILLGIGTINEYLDEWSGSYVLAIASYNAGPGNVRNWLDTYGDPRDPNVDPIDWMESIPFPETRNYVQRVLENLEVYRNRLSNSDQKLAILSDLYRPNAVNLAAARPVTATAAPVAATAATATVVAPNPATAQ
jgi:soluble lytic murein transglycosylase